MRNKFLMIAFCSLWFLLFSCSDSTDSDTKLPATPKLSTNVTNITPTSLTVSWTKVEGATSYIIEFDSVFERKVSSISANASDPNTLTHTETLTENTKYSIRVKAKNASGSSAYSNAVTATTAQAQGSTRQNIILKDDGNGVGNLTLDANNIYLLEGFVFVNAGQTLTIPAGTIIKGQAGQGSGASALVVARGGRIEAKGTEKSPVIFTSVIDQIQPGETVSRGLPPSSRGLWGGVMILGKAGLNTQPETQAIEGIPTSETRGLYGGTTDDDNSGTFEYVSIRFGGTDIGAGNEINGLTLAGVGNKTTVRYVEVFGNNDDGVELFGGTVSLYNVVAANCKDDAFDYDQGWRGVGQNWLVYQSKVGDRGGEHDGGTEPETGTPYATPIITNVTFMGQGSDAGKRAITFRDNAGGKYYNSIFVEYAKGIDVEDLDSGEDSFARLEASDLTLQNNIFWNVAGNDKAKIIISNIVATQGSLDLSSHKNVLKNEILNPSLNAFGVPSSAKVSEEVNDLKAFDNLLSNGTLKAYSYKGAFEPATTGWHTWTYLYATLK